MEQLTILLIVIPLMVAPITALIPSEKITWLLTLIVCLISLAISSYILYAVIDGSHVIYELGGWRPPWGIEYKIDSLNAFVALIVSGIGCLACLFGYRSVPDEIEEKTIPLFYAAFQLCLLGLLGIALTGDIFNLFVFLEISSLATYALISMGKNRKALTAAFSYLILGTIGATFFLIGVGFLFAASGSLNTADIANRFSTFEDMQLVETALIFMVMGIALKAAIFPLHSWLPNAYSQAPSTVSVFLSATATKVSIYVLLRILYDLYPIQYWVDMLLPQIMLSLGCVAVIYGSYRAYQQTEMKRLLAFSSVAQIGYIVIGFSLVNQLGLTAAIIHLFNHALIKATLFIGAGILLYRANTTELGSLRGLGKDMPWTFAAITLAGLSLIGVPGTVGFVTKWYLLEAAVEKGMWIVVITIVLGSVLAIGYVWKIVENLYFRSKRKTHIQDVHSGDSGIAKAPKTMVTALWIGAALCIFFGLNTELSFQAASSAASALLKP
ncbi:monovalent cation/H+ antiporter subunit D family protein [Brumicola nitratireducens]|uniref:NADH dehydrogenase/oxidoreductase n=1 Tax=Glaciecola nitratireducens (strain JCM 12485 / KCTC 12276 / FR1064) TaxID=1085623 RepID=G4QK83_GLANF|nr:monovalent cation/H+ antiporter subunit D family protein [Glaciecola nitratireducens]AEP29282.1 NADH dehydrogenase/oxidoreductase [Glaciecola nitratireducens FR1064]